MPVCTGGRRDPRSCRRSTSSRRSSTTRIVYGQIAAANALSDVYAMGGRPLTALAIAGVPEGRSIDADRSAQIFRGGFDKLREAGVALLGGHTVQDPEDQVRLCGDRRRRSRRASGRTPARRPGDVLILTKPIGTGIVGTAIKFERAPAGARRARRSRSMRR